MAFVTADRVRDTSTTAGSGSFSVSGTAPTGYRTFSAVLSVSDTFYYSIQHQTLNEWEVGLGTYTSANTFSRTTIYSSSNAGSAVTFSAGTKDVFITMAAARSLQLDASGNATPSVNGILAWQSVQTGNFTAVAGNAYPVNTTSGAVTVTLPASPAAGNIVQLTDYAGTWAINNVTVSPNGAKIAGSTSNAIVSASRGSIALVYIDTTQGWIGYSDISNPIIGQQYTASYLLVAGGGAGGVGANILGTSGGGGGGGGGILSGATTLVSKTIYSVVVGAGGASVNGTPWYGGNGSNSSALGLIAIGGGGGGGTSTVAGVLPQAGGSGGGASNFGGTGATRGSGTNGQGYSGGLISGTQGAPNYPSAGGGGGGNNGGDVTSSSVGGSGGGGFPSGITGSFVAYSGGGGGATYGGGTPGAGGAGGGGAGANGSANGTAGTVNTGGGGGGADMTSTTFYSSGAGGSGIVVLSVPTANYSGTTTGSPTVTTSGTNTIIKFTASGSYTA
jgi:hypothetical protein